jgi:hypothetical protein
MVVVVERVAHKPFVGDQEVWLKIQKRNDGRLSQRTPSFDDRRILLEKYPRFFCVWSNEPPTVDCLAEWRGDEWLLIEVFNPWA